MLPTRTPTLDQFRRDTEYFSDNYTNFIMQFPEQWVAVYQGKVVGHDADVDRLIESLGKRGVPVGTTVIHFVTTEDVILLV